MRPGLALGGVAEQVHDDGAALDGLVHLKQVLAGDPAVLDGVLPRLAVLAHTDNDVEAVVAQVEALAVALGAVADQRERVVLEVLLGGCQPLSFTSNFNSSSHSQEASPAASRRAPRPPPSGRQSRSS